MCGQYAPIFNALANSLVAPTHFIKPKKPRIKTKNTRLVPKKKLKK